MTEYTFTLKFRLPDAASDPGQYVDALGAAGCDDALVGIGRPGHISLDFTRETASAEEALFGALEQVTATIPGATLVEAGPDLVGLSDIAELLGFSRQNMRKLMEAGGHDFPDPVHEGRPSIWHLARVLTWLENRKAYDIPEAILTLSGLTMQLNALRESQNVSKTFAEKVMPQLFAAPTVG